MVSVIPWPGSPPNPAWSEAADAVRSWAGRFGLLDDPERRAILAKAQPAYVAAKLCPIAPPAVLALTAQWLTVNFVVDDLLDGEDNPYSCATAARQLLAALDHGTDADTQTHARADPAAYDPVYPATAELWDRTATGRSADWCRALRGDLADWLDSYAREALERASGRVPPVSEYRRHRRLSSGMLVFTDLAELALGVDLPATVRGLAVVRTLRAATAEYMGLVNDIYSVDKELASGQVHNAVCVVMHHSGAELAGAVRTVADMAAECLRALGHAEESLGDALGSRGVMRCVAGYRMLMRGALDCCSELDRYASAQSAIPGRTLS
jgi:(+)-beta-caryophyllene/(+)-caryolan-1-ol synthase